MPQRHRLLLESGEERAASLDEIATRLHGRIAAEEAEELLNALGKALADLDAVLDEVARADAAARRPPDAELDESKL
ncbi:hypothetical protein [Sphingomonas sp.]|uniref:hypothetical protein n=1 Tax=Sphingomonas sp. TaxID=28214 RepID=UPI001B011C6F|nr:hypothetical protein [Sphingomonas sp.]MBO9714941.1 hypothetical protein [Sphingomonas sp.]